MQNRGIFPIFLYTCNQVVTVFVVLMNRDCQKFSSFKKSGKGMREIRLDDYEKTLVDIARAIVFYLMQ